MSQKYDSALICVCKSSGEEAGRVSHPWKEANKLTLRAGDNYPCLGYAHGEKTPAQCKSEIE